MSRTIVITGAGAGIGLEAARKFAQRGAGRCAPPTSTTGRSGAREQELGPRHTYTKMDVTDKARSKRVFAEFAGQHGGAFDTLLNNAGVAFIQNFEEQTLEQHELVAKVNINGVLNCTYLAFPYLSKGRDAKVINMCSLSAEYGIPSEATYSASKFFVRGFTEAMNIEWERHGIHVCDVLPNFVATPMMDAAHGDIVDSIGINLTADDVARDDRQGRRRTAPRCTGWSTPQSSRWSARVMNNSPAPLHRAADEEVRRVLIRSRRAPHGRTYNLTGRSVIVTGASGGIGSATTRALVNRGAHGHPGRPLPGRASTRSRPRSPPSACSPARRTSPASSR